MCSFVAVGPLFGGGFSASSGGYTFSVPGLPPAAHALAKTSFLFDHGNYAHLRLRSNKSAITAPFRCYYNVFA